MLANDKQIVTNVVKFYVISYRRAGHIKGLFITKSKLNNAVKIRNEK